LISLIAVYHLAAVGGPEFGSAGNCILEYAERDDHACPELSNPSVPEDQSLLFEELSYALYVGVIRSINAYRCCRVVCNHHPFAIDQFSYDGCQILFRQKILQDYEQGWVVPAGNTLRIGSLKNSEIRK
jgi:hypothetical protein